MKSSKVEMISLFFSFPRAVKFNKESMMSSRHGNMFRFTGPLCEEEFAVNREILHAKGL